MSINPKLSPRIAVLVLTIACVGIGMVEMQALKAKEIAARPPANTSPAECIRCHSDKKTIQRMWEKEDGANFLFNPDGTLKGSNLPANHPVKAEVVKAMNEWNATSHTKPSTPSKK